MAKQPLSYQLHVGGADTYNYYSLIQRAAKAARLDEISLGVFGIHQYWLPEEAHLPAMIKSMEMMGSIIINEDAYEILDGKDIQFFVVRTTETSDFTTFVLDR